MSRGYCFRQARVIRRHWMRFSWTAGAHVNVFPLFGVSYLWHNVLQLTASLVGAVIIAKSVHHLFILELVPVRHWKMTRDKLSFEGFKCLSEQTEVNLRCAASMSNYRTIQKYKCLYKLKVKSVEGGSLGWTQGDMDQKKLPFSPQSGHKSPHKTKRSSPSTMIEYHMQTFKGMD